MANGYCSWTFPKVQKYALFGNVLFNFLHSLFFQKKELLLSVISFTSLLIEHSFSRHLYNSIEVMVWKWMGQIVNNNVVFCSI